MKVEVSKAVDVFFSYAHQDDELKRELEKQLSFLKRQGLISGWNDRDIKAGQEWTSEIDIHLNAAQIILLLISPDFIASDYCYSVEMKQAMKRQEAGKVRIIPIILRPVYWHDEPFSKFQVLPTEGKPVTTWINRDEAFLDIARGIREVVRDLLKERWLEKSKTLRKSNNYIEALSAIEKAIQLDPTYAQAFCEKGIIYRDRLFYSFDEDPFKIDFDKALAAFEKAVQLDPSYASAHYEKAGLYYLIKNYKDALPSIEKAIRLVPNGSTYYRKKGDILYALQEYKNALVTYNQALQLNDKDEHAYMAKGNTLYNLKQFEEALLAYKKSIQLAPSGTAYEKMGEVYEQLAQQAYKKAEEFMRAPEL